MADTLIKAVCGLLSPVLAKAAPAWLALPSSGPRVLRDDPRKMGYFFFFPRPPPSTLSSAVSIYNSLALGIWLGLGALIPKKPEPQGPPSSR